MNAFTINDIAHAKLKSLLGEALPGVKSSHRAEAIARGFGFASNAALLVAIQPVSTLVMTPIRFEEYLAGKGWTVPGSVFVAACFGLRPWGLNTLHVPRWGTAFIDDEWIGLVLWERGLAQARLTVPKGAYGPTWLAGVNLSGVPLTLFRDEPDPMPLRFQRDSRAALGSPPGSIQPAGEFTDLGPYLGGERFPRVMADVPTYEIYGARSLPVKVYNKADHEAYAKATGDYAGLVTF